MLVFFAGPAVPPPLLLVKKVLQRWIELEALFNTLSSSFMIYRIFSPKILKRNLSFSKKVERFLEIFDLFFTF